MGAASHRRPRGTTRGPRAGDRPDHRWVSGAWAWPGSRAGLHCPLTLEDFSRRHNIPGGTTGVSISQSMLGSPGLWEMSTCGLVLSTTGAPWSSGESRSHEGRRRSHFSPHFTKSPNQFLNCFGQQQIPSYRRTALSFQNPGLLRWRTHRNVSNEWDALAQPPALHGAHVTTLRTTWVRGPEFLWPGSWLRQHLLQRQTHLTFK